MTGTGRDEVAGIVLAAGAGTRLRPLTDIRPKALCPVAGVPLVDLAIERVEDVTSAIAVNAHHERGLLESHLARRVHLSIEDPEPLGTAGALGQLRPWIDGRPALVVNADAWTQAPLADLLDGWDGERVRLLLVRPGANGALPSKPRLAGALLPWSEVEPLRPEPSGLWEVSWRRAHDEGRLEVVPADGPFVDCGTPAAYLAANMAASGGEPVVGAGSVVEGELVRSVVWPASYVGPRERLVDCVRIGDRLTVAVRS